MNFDTDTNFDCLLLDFQHLWNKQQNNLSNVINYDMILSRCDLDLGSRKHKHACGFLRRHVDFKIEKPVVVYREIYTVEFQRVIIERNSWKCKYNVETSVLLAICLIVSYGAYLPLTIILYVNVYCSLSLDVSTFVCLLLCSNRWALNWK